VEDVASVSGNLGLAYLFVLFYIAVAAPRSGAWTAGDSAWRRSRRSWDGKAEGRFLISALVENARRRPGASIVGDGAVLGSSSRPGVAPLFPAARLSSSSTPFWRGLKGQSEKRL
jgi:hypothetical protein